MKHLDKMTLHAAIISFLILRFIGGAVGQTTCNPLMQSLVQQADMTGQYGSWDACCAHTGDDCFLTQVTAPPGFEPCDPGHSARAGCNRTPQGTVCMIGMDTSISDSPCSASHIQVCDTVLILDGVNTPFDGFANLGVTPAQILSRGLLETQLCCSTSLCHIDPACTLQYNMSCITDAINIICVPLDQANAQTYAAVTYGCASTSSISPSGVATHVTSSASPNDHVSNTGIIIVGVTVTALCVLLAVIFTCLVRRWRARSRSGVSETPLVDEANFSDYPVSVPLQSMQGFVHPPGQDAQMSHAVPHNTISATGRKQIIIIAPPGSAQATSTSAPVIPITQIPTNPMPAGADGLTPAQIEFVQELYNRNTSTSDIARITREQQSSGGALQHYGMETNPPPYDF